MTARLAYSVKRSAHLLDMSGRSIRYLMQTGRLGFARIGRRIVIPHAELEKFLRKVSVKATQELDADEPIRPSAQTETPSAVAS
jgi:excisionase family DNA binding protein